MPRYSDKMRLIRYCTEHGECDALTEYLILSGHSDIVVESGLRILVERWEESVSRIGKGHPAVYEESSHDLWQRCELFLVLEHALPEQIAPYRERIALYDEVFKEGTMEIESPCDIYPDEIKQPDHEVHWWLFRIPKKGL